MPLPFCDTQKEKIDETISELGVLKGLRHLLRLEYNCKSHAPSKTHGEVWSFGPMVEEEGGIL